MRLDRTQLRNAGRWLLHRSAPLLALFLLLVVYFLGVRTERSGFVQQVLDPGLKRITRPVLNAFRGGAPQVDQVALLFSDSAWRVLDTLTFQVHDGTVIDTQLTSLAVTAELRWNSDTMSVQVLAWNEGDDGTTADRSFMVYTSGVLPGTGTHEAQVTPPGAGSVLHQWLFARALERAGLPHFPVALAELELNGMDKGLYCWRSRVPRWRREHTTLDWGAYDAGLFERAQLLRKGGTNTVQLPQETWQVAPLQYRGNAAEGPLSAVWARTMRKLQGDAPAASALVDAQRLGALLALCDLFGVATDLDWRELRFALDPESGRLVPFLPGKRAGQPITDLLIRTPSDDQLLATVLADGAVQAAYHGWLERLEFGGWTDSLLLEAAPASIELQDLLRIDPDLAPYDTAILVQNRTVITRMLAPPDAALAYLHPGGQRIRLASLHPLPLDVVGLVVAQDTLPLPRDLQLEAHVHGGRLAYRELPLDRTGPTPDLVLLRIPGTVRMLAVRVQRSGSLNAWDEL